MTDVRDAEPEDAPAITAIYNESIAAQDSTMQLEAVGVETVERWIRDAGEREAVLVLVEADAVVGYGVVKRYSDRGGYRYAAETSVYLWRNRTGEGLGSRLQAALIDRCRGYNYNHLVAKLWAENERSRALHRKFGYELVGVQREIGYVDGEWRDVAIMQKRLGTPATNDG
jgi:phosphinothricin acetyltransferase